MPQGDKNKKNAGILYAKMALKVKFAMALYQKLDFIRSTIYVESFIIVSRSAQNAQFFALCRCTIDDTHEDKLLGNMTGRM